MLDVLSRGLLTEMPLTTSVATQMAMALTTTLTRNDFMIVSQPLHTTAGREVSHLPARRTAEQSCYFVGLTRTRIVVPCWSSTWMRTPASATLTPTPGIAAFQ